jgi:acetyl-CoA C-acetyltransferase
LRSMITGQPVEITEQPDDTPEPDIHHQIPDPFSSDLEAERGVWAPGEFYAIADSALRHAKGYELNDYRDHIAQMYSEFSEVAANNPHAWRQEKLSPGDIRTVTDKNGMIAFPYTKNHLSQWNVNQAVAVMVCSYGKAKALGLDESGWIYPLAAVQSRNVVALAQKPQLHSHHGSRLGGERAFALAGLTPADVEVADMYSCFPVAIQAYASDLKLPESLPLSVTGSMAYGGGPFNHGGLDSTARVAEVLREKSGGQHVGLITNLSGMFGKQGCLLLGTEPNPKGFGFDDITEQVAELEQAIPLNGSYEGPATIVGYSVMFNKGALSHAVAYCDTPEGERTVVRSDNEEVLAMTETEYVGKTVQVSVDGGFRL